MTETKTNKGNPIKKTKSRLDSLEKGLSNLQKQQSEILKYLKKSTQKQEEDPEEVPGRQPEEMGDVEEDEKSKKKGEMGSKETKAEADPKGGEVKLPKAPVGETGENAKPEGGSVSISKQELKKSMQEVLKEMGFNVAQGERPQADVQKHSNQTAQQQSSSQGEDFAKSLMKKVRSGEMTLAEMNKQIKKFSTDNHHATIEKALKATRESDAQSGGN